MGDEQENQSPPEALDELSAEQGDAAPEGQDFGSLDGLDSSAQELAAALESMEPMEESESALESPLEGLGDLAAAPLAQDPALDVDQMLAAEVLPDAVLESLPALSSEAVPTFQLQLEIKPEQREALKAVAQSLSLSLPEGGSPLLSQLTEYQAIAFRQAALAIGASVKASVHFPLPSLSEEEQALGDLALVKDEPLPIVEGAPSVVLPKHEQEVMVLTEVGGNIQVLQTFGLVTAHRSIARRFFREEEAQEKLRKELQQLPGRSAGMPASRLEALLRELILDLQKMALQRGGNALFGLRLESFPETSHLDPELEQMRLVAFGTAAIVEKSLQA